MEPERPIEKLLRDAGKKRRDDAGAPFELHPAARRLLQGEVAQRFGKARFAMINFGACQRRNIRERKRLVR